MSFAFELNVLEAVGAESGCNLGTLAPNSTRMREVVVYRTGSHGVDHVNPGHTLVALRTRIEGVGGKPFVSLNDATNLSVSNVPYDTNVSSTLTIYAPNEADGVTWTVVVEAFIAGTTTYVAEELQITGITSSVAIDTNCHNLPHNNDRCIASVIQLTDTADNTASQTPFFVTNLMTYPLYVSIMSSTFGHLATVGQYVSTCNAVRPLASGQLTQLSANSTSEFRIIPSTELVRRRDPRDVGRHDCVLQIENTPHTSQRPTDRQTVQVQFEVDLSMARSAVVAPSTPPTREIL
jgi:hypothetical protein